MTIARTIPAPNTEERMQRLAVAETRLNALDRLYKRRATVDRLIRLLEVDGSRRPHTCQMASNGSGTDPRLLLSIVGGRVWQGAK